MQNTLDLDRTKTAIKKQVLTLTPYRRCFLNLRTIWKIYKDASEMLISCFRVFSLTYVMHHKKCKDVSGCQILVKCYRHKYIFSIILFTAGIWCKCSQEFVLFLLGGVLSRGQWYFYPNQQTLFSSLFSGLTNHFFNKLMCFS